MNALRVCCAVLAVAVLWPQTGQSQASTADSAGAKFHRLTSYGDEGFKGGEPTFGRNVPLYKGYENAPRTKLPAPAATSLSVESALENRRSVRSFGERPLAMSELSRIILSANGLTQIRSGVARRTAPSAGALYPMELYIVVSRVDNLAPGIYHFHEPDSTLELIAEGDFDGDIHAAANFQNSVGSSPITLVLAARFDRVTQKYADRGYRYAYMEAGAVMQNVYLQSSALDLGTVTVGAFNDDACNELLGIDGVSEAALWIMPVGRPE
jgi:SagB-type dehydrogenase family enzyme